MNPERDKTVIDDNMELVLFTAVQAAREAGGVIREVYGSDFAVERKEDRSPLTLADTRSHQVISRWLGDGPLNTVLNGVNLPVLSEEGRDIPYEERKQWGCFWLVDPLDGTKEFVKRNGEFTVNIALICDRVPVMGVIYVPVTDVLYFAASGRGAFRVRGRDADDSLGLTRTGWDYAVHMMRRLMTPSARIPEAGGNAGRPFTVVASRSHRSPKVDAYVDGLRRDHPDVEFTSAGSALKFCLVADGRADVYPRFGPTMEWDTGAGQCIVEESGGRVEDLNGARFSYNKENLLNGEFIVSGATITAKNRS